MPASPGRVVTAARPAPSALAGCEGEPPGPSAAGTEHRAEPVGVQHLRDPVLPGADEGLRAVAAVRDLVVCLIAIVEDPEAGRGKLFVPQAEAEPRPTRLAAIGRAHQRAAGVAVPCSGRRRARSIWCAVHRANLVDDHPRAKGRGQTSGEPAA